jgi:hypothetical protein
MTNYRINRGYDCYIIDNSGCMEITFFMMCMSKYNFKTKFSSESPNFYRWSCAVNVLLVKALIEVLTTYARCWAAIVSVLSQKGAVDCSEEKTPAIFVLTSNNKLVVQSSLGVTTYCGSRCGSGGGTMETTLNKFQGSKSTKFASKHVNINLVHCCGSDLHS